MSPTLFGHQAALANSTLSRRVVLTGMASLSAAAVLGTTACSGENPDKPGAELDLSKVSAGSMPDFKAGQQFTATEDLTFDMFFPEWPDAPYKKDWLVWQELTKRTKVTINASIVPLSDYPSKRSLLINAGNAPMLIPLTYVGEESPFTASGAVLPVSEYVHLMPNFQARVKEWGLEEDINRMRQADGRYYLLPGMFEKPHPDFSLTFRLDVLKEEGLEVPKTWDEVRTVLERLKKRQPDSYPFSDMYQGNATLMVASVAFGTNAGWGYGTGTRFDPATDAFVYTAMTPEYKEFITYFHGLVADGLMDPESFTQDGDIAERKFVTGKSFVTNGNYENIPGWQHSMTESLGEGKFDIAKIPVPGGPAGTLMDGGRLWHGFMISSKAKESPNFLAMLQFIDWLCYDQTAKELLKWGVEGVTYTKDGSGKRAPAKDVNTQGLNPAGKKDLEKDFGFSLNLLADGGSVDIARSAMPPLEVAFQEAMEGHDIAPVSPAAPLTDEEREQATLLVTPLTDSVTSTALKFILGRRPLSEWDAFQAEIKGNGVDQYLELVNSAYKRFKTEHGG